MIVQMKKVSLVIYEGVKKEALQALKELGVVHLETKYGDSETIREMSSRIEEAKGIHNILQGYAGKGQSDNPSGAETVVESVKELLDEKSSLQGEWETLTKHISELMPWGDFDPKDIEVLEDKGIKLKLFSATADQYKKLDPALKPLKIRQIKSQVLFALVNAEEVPPLIEEFNLPNLSLSAMTENKALVENRLKEIEVLLSDFGNNLEQVERLIKRYEDHLEDQLVDYSTHDESSLCVIEGYSPVDHVEDLKTLASQIGMGLLIRDPGEEDRVPTLVKRKGPIRIIKPLFDLLGTVPGYNEYDISAAFLIAMSLFVAMIIGDAGYGAIFLLIGVLGLVRSKSAVAKDGFWLLTLFSTTTVIWGSVTGNWFGSEAVANLPFLKQFVIPQIATFADKGVDTAYNIKIMCFAIGLIHLTLARLEAFIKTLPKLKAFAELGWMIMLWGLFSLVMTLVMSTDILFGINLANLTIPLAGTGLALVILFANQEGNFIKGVLAGINPINLLLSFLDSISAFSDIISYIRLFAVGLAGFSVAASFNAMASGFGDSVGGIIGAVLVLALGHGLNIVMALLSIIVHGVRLNMLEYSGHLSMEWAGFEYSPYKKG